MSETKHSPLPWTSDPDDRDGMEWNVHILDAVGNRVCFMTSDGPYEGNADLIVAATSLHAELVAALEDTIRMLTAVQFSAGLGRKQQERIERARTILQKAKQR